MNILLFFFAIPVAIIILSSIFQTIIGCPIKIAGIIFSIFLIVAFALTDNTEELLVATIVYTIIAYISAYITCIIISRNYNYNYNCCENIQRNCCDNLYTSSLGTNYNENFENNNFTIQPQINDNLNTNNSNLNTNNCPYRRYR